MRKAGAAILLAAVLGWTTTVFGQAGISSRSGHVSLGGDVGLTIDPELFAGQAAVDYYLTDSVAVGPLFQAGTGREGIFWGLSGQVKYSAALANTDTIRPYGTLGIGFVNFYFNDINDRKMKTSFLVPVGGGFEFEVADDLTLDTNILFNAAEDIFVGIYFGGRVLF